MSSHKQVFNVGLALALGSLGGLLFYAVNLPLPWLLGSLTATLIASIAGMPVEIRSGLRKYIMIVLGVMLGGAFSPDILTRASEWMPTLAAAVFYLFLITLVAQRYCQYVMKMGRVTALFSGMPGGLSEMVFLGEEFNADVRALTLTHMVRIATVLVAIPFFLTYGVGIEGHIPPIPQQVWDIKEILILFSCGVGGYFAAKLLHMPAPALMGPMLLSAGVHMTGLIIGDRPIEVSLVLQVTMGSALGGRFFGISIFAVGRLLVLAMGMALTMMAVTLLSAAVLAAVTGFSFESLVLALSPGGIAEMTLVALSMNIDPAFVTTHHGLRLFLIVFLMPLLFSHRLRHVKKAGKDM